MLDIIENISAIKMSVELTWSKYGKATIDHWYRVSLLHKILRDVEMLIIGTMKIVSLRRASYLHICSSNYNNSPFLLWKV